MVSIQVYIKNKNIPHILLMFYKKVVLYWTIQFFGNFIDFKIKQTLFYIYYINSLIDTTNNFLFLDLFVHNLYRLLNNNQIHIRYINKEVFSKIKHNYFVLFFHNFNFKRVYNFVDIKYITYLDILHNFQYF